MKELTEKPKVYVIQQIPGTSEGTPRINILGAKEFGDFVFRYKNDQEKSLHILEQLF